MGIKIIGTGSHVPQKIVTNDDLSRTLDTSDEWIRTRTGIGQRYIAGEDTAASLASQAADKALLDAGTPAEAIDLIIVATSSPDYIFPNTASLVQKHIGAAGAMCFDISAACTGFIYALSTAEALIDSGQYQKALVIGSEVMSGEVDWRDRSVCVLFGDGAGAAVIAADTGPSNVSCLHTDGDMGHVLTGGRRKTIQQGRPDYIYMDGQAVFKFAVKKVPESIREVLEQADVPIAEIRYFILHQANIRIIESVAKRLGVEMEKFPTNLEAYGNTSAASIPILLDEMNRSHKLHRGDKIILSGFGAGLSWGSTLLTW